MDAISMLGENRAAPLDLTGLSPEEIRGVSAGRISREQMMNQGLNLLMDQRKMQSTIASQVASRKLTEARTRKLEEPVEMTTMTDPEGKRYSIPKSDIVQGLSYMNQAKRNKELNLLTVAQTEAMEKRVPITVGEGETAQTYQVSPAQYSAMAEAGRKRKEAKIKADALKAIEGKSPQELMTAENFSNFIIASPSSAAAMVNKLTPEGTAGLSDAQYRYYADFVSTLANNVLKMDSPDDMLLSTVNDTYRKMHSSHMLLKVPNPRLWGAAGMLGYTKAVTVNLPPNVTANMVYEEAEKRGIDVSEILQNIYDRTQESK